MAKKMTNKEFKQVLTDAGMDFELYGYEGILNSISLSYRKSAEDCENAGLKNAAKKCRDVEDAIYKALESLGYYDDVR